MDGSVLQAANVRDGFLMEERREPQRNKMKDVEGVVGCSRVEKVRCW